MTALAPPVPGLLAVAALFAVAHWVAVALGRKSVEYAVKPAVMATLIAVAAALEPTDDTQRLLVLLALVLSLMGDVYLMLPEDRFLEGLVAFLLAHVAFVAAFAREVVGPLEVVIAGIVLAGAMIPVGRVIVRGVRDRASDALVRPVLVYMALIGVMVTLAVATRDPVAATGAGLFIVSDGLLAWNRFVAPRPWLHVVVMVTYHLGQAGIVLSLVV